jgi:hypothetical protein
VGSLLRTDRGGRGKYKIKYIGGVKYFKFSILNLQKIPFKKPCWEGVMTLSKCAKLGLQVQSVVARVNFPHEENSRLILNSRGTVKKLLSFFLQQPAKLFLVLASPNLPSSCQAQGVNVSKSKYDMQYGKLNNKYNKVNMMR